MKSVELCIDQNDYETLQKVQNIFELNLSTYEEMGFDSSALTVVVIPLVALTIQALSLIIQIATYQKKPANSKENQIAASNIQNDKPKTLYLRDAYGEMHLGEYTAQEVIEIIEARNSKEA